MAQRGIGEREQIVETFLDSNEEISDMGDRKRRRYSQLMARFKRDTLTWNLSQRRRFCGHANSLLRTLKKPERLELHYSGNKLVFRIALVDVRRRKNNEENNANNERRDEQANERDDDLGQNEENNANNERRDEQANERDDDLGQNEENNANNEQWDEQAHERDDASGQNEENNANNERRDEQANERDDGLGQNEENNANNERRDEQANERDEDLGQNEENEADTDWEDDFRTDEESDDNQTLENIVHNERMDEQANEQDDALGRNEENVPHNEGRDEHANEQDDAFGQNENERRIEDHVDRENLNLEDNEIVVRQGDKRCVKRVYRYTTRQKRGKRPVAETSELSVLRVEINNKDRAIRKKNLEIRSEKRNIYAQIPAFCKFAKMMTTMKLVLTELPVESKPMKLIEIHKEAVNGVKNLWGIHANTSLGDLWEKMDEIIDISPLLLDDLLLARKDDDVFVSPGAGVSFLQSLEKLRTDLEQLREDKEALENKLKEMVQN